MKTTLYLIGESYYVKAPQQELTRVTRSAARRFILNYQHPDYCSDTTEPDEPTQDFGGSVIAEVTNDNCLLVRDAQAFKSLVENDGVIWVSVKDYADLHGKRPAIVRRHCQNNLIEGAMLTPGGYIIPEDAPYPK